MREIGIGLANSSDGLQWTRPEEPFLVLTEAGRFPHIPDVLEIGDFLIVYYASVLTVGTDGRIELEILPRRKRAVSMMERIKKGRVMVSAG